MFILSVFGFILTMTPDMLNSVLLSLASQVEVQVEPKDGILYVKRISYIALRGVLSCTVPYLGIVLVLLCTTCM